MSQSLLVCAYRNMSVSTHDAIIAILNRPGWQHQVRYGDALISRARSIVVSDWYRNTRDDVCLMVDDDIVFTPDDAERLVSQCRNGYDIISAAIPVHNGQYIAVRPSPGVTLDLQALTPLSMDYVGAAFVAIHRRVIDQMVGSLPLCHPSLPVAFWPFYQPYVDFVDGEPVYLSEDWAFAGKARSAGCKVWLDPTLRVGHRSEITLNVDNMEQFHRIFGERW